MRGFLGRQIARHEHASRRIQSVMWLLMTINTTVVAVWGTVPIETLLLFWSFALIVTVTFGYFSQRSHVGNEITKATFNIESKELWVEQVGVSAALIAHFIQAGPEKTKEYIERHKALVGKDIEENEENERQG